MTQQEINEINEALTYKRAENLCEEEGPSGKWGCTRKPGHDGKWHVATDGRRIQEMWPRTLHREEL